jgi:hypothetical protein
VVKWVEGQTAPPRTIETIHHIDRLTKDENDDSFMAEMKSSVAKQGRAILSAAQAKKARREEAVKGLLNSALKSGQEKRRL